MTEERFAKLNSTRYGKLVEAVEPAAEEAAGTASKASEKRPAARKATTAKKGTASRSRARKSAQEG